VRRGRGGNQKLHVQELLVQENLEGAEETAMKKTELTVVLPRWSFTADAMH
jgi:hypothetical protein